MATDPTAVTGRERSRTWWRIVSCAFAATMLVDIGGAVISKAARIDYGYFGILSVVIYVLLGVTGVRRMSLLATTCAAFAVATGDATIGAYAAVKLGVLHLSFATFSDVAATIFAAKLVIALCTIVSVISGVITLKFAAGREN